MSEWHPIRSIPRDGTEVLVSYGHQGHVKQLVWWDKIHGLWICKGQPILGLEANATHWMEIPEIEEDK